MPDGYTLMMASASYVTHALMYRAPYHPVCDFTPLTQVSAQPYVLVVHASVPAATAGEFIAYAKGNLGRLNYASSGNGGLFHLTGELFKSMTGESMVRAPYKGMAADGSEPVSSTPNGFAAHIKSEFAKWDGVIRNANIRGE